MEKKQPATQRPTVLFSMIFAVFVSLVLAPCIHFSNRPFLARAAAAEQWSAAPAVVTAETGYYTDVDYDWIHNPGLLERGLRYFDQMTGVHPYVYILPNGTTTSTSDLRSCAEYLYSELFPDDAHFILVFCDDGEGGYNCGYAVGSQAKTIMDSEAISILGDCLEHCYGDLSLSEEEIFSNAFIKTAEHIARADLALQMGGSDAVPDDCVEYGEYTYVILEDGTAKIVRWCGDDTALEVPSSIDGWPVSSIGAFAFAGPVETISMPASVDALEGNPVALCGLLEKIEVRGDEGSLVAIDGVLFDSGSRSLLCCPRAKSGMEYMVPGDTVSVGEYAFYGCKNLSTVGLNDNVEEVASSAFDRCGSLTSIQVSPDNETLASIDGVLFRKSDRSLLRYPEGLSEPLYYVPDGILSIGPGAFRGCGSLWKVMVPEGVVSVGEFAFSACGTLASVSLPGTVKDIGSSPFSDCPCLEEISVSGKGQLATVGGALVDTGASRLICLPAGRGDTVFEVPEGVMSIGDGAFSRCSSLQSVSLPDGLELIGSRAFESCSALESVYVPKAVSAIGDRAFFQCSALEFVAVGGASTTVGEQAFDGCSSLGNVVVQRESPAREYCKESGLTYSYPDSNDWLGVPQVNRVDNKMVLQDDDQLFEELSASYGLLDGFHEQISAIATEFSDALGVDDLTGLRNRAMDLQRQIASAANALDSLSIAIDSPYVGTRLAIAELYNDLMKRISVLVDACNADIAGEDVSGILSRDNGPADEHGHTNASLIHYEQNYEKAKPDKI